MRQTDDGLHPKAIERQEQRARQEAEAARATLWKAVTSTALGSVSFFPIIRGTQTDNHFMMTAGFLAAMVAFRIMPLDKLVALVSAWKGGAS